MQIYLIFGLSALLALLFFGLQSEEIPSAAPAPLSTSVTTTKLPSTN